ncbi:hypothetical protein [Nonomuraea sp. NPDC050691]
MLVTAQTRARVHLGVHHPTGTVGPIRVSTAAIQLVLIPVGRSSCPSHSG